MDNSRKYEYVMDLSEIREFCRFAYWEQLKQRKRKWIAILLIIAAEAVFLPEAAMIVSIVLVVSLIATGIYFYRSTIRLLEGQLWTVFRIEDDKLRVTRGSCVEIPFRSIQFIRRTKRLIMLGYMQNVKRPAWFVMPFRAFGNEQEAEAFLDRIRSAQAQPDFAGPTKPMRGGADFAGAAGQMPGQVDFTGAAGKMPGQPDIPDQAKQGADGEAPREYMRFSYFLDPERWVRLQKGAADLLNGGTFGRAARTYGMIIWGSVTAVALSICTCLVVGEVQWMLVCYSVLLAVWLVLRLFGRDPGKRIRKQLDAPEIAARSCGPWQAVLTEEGVTVHMPMDMKSYYGWESLMWLIETQEAFYLFYRDKKHFIMIAKESFVSWDQVDAFYRICKEHGVQKIMPKRARYVPEWLTWTIFALIMLVSVGTFMVRIYLDAVDSISDRRISMTGGYTGAASADPGRVPLDEQVEVLASLGLDVPEETVESVRSAMVEYGLYELVEDSPYTWLLTDMGAPDYDEDWKPVGYSEEVFWFDFEGFDLSTDYIEVLNGMLALAQGSPLDSVSNIVENTEDVDWEKGRGTIVVSLEWEGRTYQYDMEVYDDWIDANVLFIYNELLEGQDFQKRFYATGDNGQGVIVFFCTKEWAAEFSEKTGMILE